jgi:hypothetical protein
MAVVGQADLAAMGVKLPRWARDVTVITTGKREDALALSAAT